MRFAHTAAARAPRPDRRSAASRAAAARSPRRDDARRRRRRAAVRRPGQLRRSGVRVGEGRRAAARRRRRRLHVPERGRCLRVPGRPCGAHGVLRREPPVAARATAGRRPTIHARHHRVRVGISSAPMARSSTRSASCATRACTWPCSGTGATSGFRAGTRHPTRIRRSSAGGIPRPPTRGGRGAQSPLIADSGLPIFVSTPDLLPYVPEATWLPVVVDVDRWSGAATGPRSSGTAPSSSTHRATPASREAS